VFSVFLLNDEGEESKILALLSFGRKRGGEKDEEKE
jgi:hypothetical protein